MHEGSWDRQRKNNDYDDKYPSVESPIGVFFGV
jgi:hypothetical protein